MDQCACGNIKQKVSKTCVLCFQNTRSAGEFNGNWKGGITKHKAGYVQVRMTDVETGVSTYIFEHRLVMQDYLGRVLLPTETVHHKNGIKTDNRLDNLELWVTYQPSGQRVSDLIKHAQWVFETYGNDPDKYAQVE